MIITIAAFTGELPRVATHLLPNEAAQVAANTYLAGGELKAQKGLGSESKRSGGLTDCNGAYFCDDGNFLCWTGERSVARSQVIDDFYKRIYFVDGSAYLHAGWQHMAVEGVVGWSSGTTYAAGAEVLYPMPAYGNYSNATSYNRGDKVKFGGNFLYRSLQDTNLNHTPNLNPAWWELWGEGIRYVSLQNGNLAKQPNEQPTWWLPNGVSLVGSSTRAGVPAPVAWPTKTGSNYNANVVTGDEEGLLDVYHVPQSVADARAETDTSDPTSALIAVARNTLLDNVVLRASASDDVNTASAYYGASGVKVQENLVQLEEIERGRRYAFDAPDKADSINQYVVTQIWIEAGTVERSPILNPEHQGQ